MLYIYVAVGGVVGTLARFGVARWVYGWAGVAFPWGTLLVNLAGSFVLGLVVRGSELSTLSPELRGAIVIGFCGAFTTFSTFTYETVALMHEGAWVRAALYVVGSVGLGLVAIALGFSAASLLLRSGA